MGFFNHLTRQICKYEKHSKDEMKKYLDYGASKIMSLDN